MAPRRNSAPSVSLLRSPRACSSFGAKRLRGETVGVMSGMDGRWHSGTSSGGLLSSIGVGELLQRVAMRTAGETREAHDDSQCAHCVQAVAEIDECTGDLLRLLSGYGFAGSCGVGIYESSRSTVDVALALLELSTWLVSDRYRAFSGRRKA